MIRLFSSLLRGGLLAVAAASCTSALKPVMRPARSTVDASPRRTEPEVAVAPNAPPVTAPTIDSEHALIVGNQERLELWAENGSAHRTLSEGPALHPHRVASDAVIALSGTSNSLNRGAQLVRISLRDGSRQEIAALPAFACRNAPKEDHWADASLEPVLLRREPADAWGGEPLGGNRH